MTTKDRAPIDQQWIQDYCDQLIAVAQRLGPGVMQDTTLRRIECVMDLVEAWQKRNWPIDQR